MNRFTMAAVSGLLVLMLTGCGEDNTPKTTVVVPPADKTTVVVPEDSTKPAVVVPAEGENTTTTVPAETKSE